MAKVLLLEDEDSLRLIMTQYLEGEGHEVVVSENGEVAEQKLREAKDAGQPFEKVLVDQGTPKGKSGYEIAKLSTDMGARIAVVMSGHDLKEFGFEESDRIKFVRKGSSRSIKDIASYLKE